MHRFTQLAHEAIDLACATHDPVGDPAAAVEALQARYVSLTPQERTEVSKEIVRLLTECA